MNYTDTLTPHLPIIKNCQLFHGIASSLLVDAIQYLNGTVRSYKKDDLLLPLGSPFLYSGIVLTGTIEGSFISENYNKINMNHFPAGKSFGEALAAVQTKHSPIQLSALTDCTVLFLDLHILLSSNALPESYQQILAVNLIRTLATQNIFSNLKLRIASQKTIRDKVLMYLHSLTPDENGMLQIPFSQTALAEYLGINRSAMSRELGAMQDEGLIFVQGRKMKLLLKDS